MHQNGNRRWKLRWFGNGSSAPLLQTPRKPFGRGRIRSNVDGGTIARNEDDAVDTRIHHQASFGFSLLLRDAVRLLRQSVEGADGDEEAAEESEERFRQAETGQDGTENDPNQEAAQHEEEGEGAEGHRCRPTGADQHLLEDANVRFAHDDDDEGGWDLTEKAVD